MKEVLKVYDVELTAVGPVFIGSGKEIGKKEYAFSPSEKRIFVMDLSKLSLLLSKNNLISEYGRFMLGDSREDLGSWLERHKVSKKDSMQCAKYQVDCQDAVIDTHSKLSVLEFVKDAYGMPYVPGSSLKGMLRTIIQAYDLSQNPEKYESLAEQIEGIIRTNRRRQRMICQKESIKMESVCFKTLKRSTTKVDDAVNDKMAGMVVSDSEPLTNQDLVLCQRLELHTDGTEKKLNTLRETLRPGTVIRFQITVDTSICDVGKEYLEDAIEYFANNYYNCFLNHYPEIDRPDTQSVWLGGGSGFVTKTELYPMFGKYTGVEMTMGVFQAIGISERHKHRKDKSLGVSPHICKVTYYHGKRYHMGHCRFCISEREAGNGKT